VKVGVGLLVVVGLAIAFWRSVHDTRAQPYQLQAKDLEHWALGMAEDGRPSDSYLALQAPASVINDLTGQLFKRVMESMHAPPEPAIPLLLKEEFDRAFAGRVSGEQLLAAARAAGLDKLSLVPRCLAYRRVSDERATDQLYFVIFDVPQLEQFRQQLRQLPGVDGSYDPAAMSPVLMVSGSSTAFNHWIPLRANPATDCVAPITVVP
jgi:hypothetical protein